MQLQQAARDEVVARWSDAVAGRARDVRELLEGLSTALEAIHHRAAVAMGKVVVDAILARVLRDVPTRFPSAAALEIRSDATPSLRVDTKRVRDADATQSVRDVRGVLTEVLTVFDIVTAGALTPALCAALDELSAANGGIRDAPDRVEVRGRS